MPTLHLVNKPATHDAFARSLTMTLPGDNLLLLEDGVYNALPATLRRNGLTEVRMFALKRDVDARGLSGLLGSTVALIDESAFVDLVAASQPIVTWS